MAKKNSIKDTEQTLSLFGKIRAIFKNETIHFVIGLILVIFQYTCYWPFLRSSLRERQIKVLLTPAVRRSWLLPIME